MRKPMGSSRALQQLAAGLGDDEDAEDEETLQLQLQEIQTKLKLKRMANKGAGSEERATPSTRESLRSRSPTKSTRRSSSPQPRIRRPDVQVPLSPTRDRNPPKEPVSPARARLGLSAAARAQDVSLKRARDGQLKRSDSQSTAIPFTPREAARPVSSFSQRMAESQQRQQEREARNERIARSRSTGFKAGDRADASSRLQSMPSSESLRPSKVARGERMSSPIKSGATVDSRSRSTATGGSSLRSARSDRTATREDCPRSRSRSRPPDGHDHDSSMDETGLDFPTDNPQDGSGFDPFSGIHLSKRHIAHVDVSRAMEASEIYTLPRLLREVKAPDYDPPDCESDFVVFAILASKSSPYNQKLGHRTNDESQPQEDATAPRNKFMVLHLVDLKWEIDCFLFGSGFDQFWKLTEGTLVAIQNPSILPPKTNQHNGRFSLKLGSCEDRVMEIGIARDLGYCVSVKKDGQQCGSWIDKRSTEVCEFHLNLMIEKSRKGRMEVNTMWRGTGDADNRLDSKSRRPGEGKRKKLPGKWDREHGQLFSVNTGMGKTAANLLDAEDTDALHDLTSGEASRKRIAAAQRERELARKLDTMGSSVGLDYLRAKHSSTTTITSTTSTTRSRNATANDSAKDLFDKPSASDLGLLNNKATSIRLSPAKDRKRHFGLGAVGSAGAEALGWGGAKKAGLLQPKETPSRLRSPEKGQTTLDVPARGVMRPRSQDGSLSPKKRARFALEKGIREPGRESLGTVKHADDDDDDDLDIV